MYQYKKILGALAIASFALSANLANAKDANLEKFVKGSNDFGLKIFKSLNKKDNVLYSPLSMNTALSMVGHFADADQQKSLISAMGYKGLTIEQFNKATTALTKSFESRKSETYSVNSVNSFWVDREFDLARTIAIRNFLDVYGVSPFNNEYFADQSAADAMNSWVNEATNKRIPELVTVKEVAPLDWMAINAVYFEGKWFHKFGVSFGGAFKKTDGSTSKASYIEASPGSGVTMIEKADHKVFELAYGKQERGKKTDHQGSMYIVQPNNPADLNKFVNDMTADKLAGYVQEFVDQKELGNQPYVAVNIPSFELKFDTGMDEIKKALTDGGAQELFTGFDMTRLHPSFTKTKKNKIKLIKQKANITVANTGTVAAAASAIGGGIESLGPRPVYVDSAFMYFIVDQETQAIIFAGTLTDTNGLDVPKSE